MVSCDGVFVLRYHVGYETGTNHVTMGGVLQKLGALGAVLGVRVLYPRVTLRFFFESDEPMLFEARVPSGVSNFGVYILVHFDQAAFSQYIDTLTFQVAERSRRIASLVSSRPCSRPFQGRNRSYWFTRNNYKRIQSYTIRDRTKDTIGFERP